MRWHGKKAFKNFFKNHKTIPDSCKNEFSKTMTMTFDEINVKRIKLIVWQQHATNTHHRIEIKIDSLCAMHELQHFVEKLKAHVATRK